MRRKLFSVCLIAAMVLAMIPASVLAEDAGESTGTPADNVLVQKIKVREDGPEDNLANAEYSKAYTKAGLKLSDQDVDGVYTLTIDRKMLEAVAADVNGETYQILENQNNPGKLWFGMEYLVPDGITGAVKASVAFDKSGTFSTIELDNKAKNGFYNYIKVYDNEVGPVKEETAEIDWLDAGGNVLAKTKAILKVEVKEDTSEPEQPENPTTFTVTFESNGGSAVASVTVASGEKVTKPTDPTREGYTFGGWYQDEKYTTAFDFAVGITKDTVVYARWTKTDTPSIPDTEYTITFDANGGTVSPDSQTTKDGKLEKLPEPKRSGYTFEGWYTEASGGDMVNVDKVFTANTTLYAHWTPESSTTTEYTITFDANGGTVSPDSQTTKGGKLETLPRPTRSGYTFEGWYTEASGGDQVTTETKFTKDTKLYAHWKQNSSSLPEEDEYEIHIDSWYRHGSVYTSHKYAEPGTWVTITVYPDADYRVDWVEAEREDGRLISLDRNGSRYTFRMPASDVYVDVGFALRDIYRYTVYLPEPTVQTEFVPTVSPITWRAPSALRDVPAYSWDYTAAQWAYQNGYLDLAADGSFRLNGPVSHQQMWKIMAHWLGTPVTDGRSIATWALQIGAAQGKPAAGAMTRQNVVEYLYQCYFLMGGDVSVTGNLGSYQDSQLITSASARNAWLWAVNKGIVSGTADGYLNPDAVIRRGDFATMLMRLCQNVMR